MLSMMIDMGIAVDFLPDFFSFDGVDVLEGEVLTGRAEVSYFLELGETNTKDLFDQLKLGLRIITRLGDFSDHFKLGLQISHYLLVALKLLCCCLARTERLFSCFSFGLDSRPLVR